ncbi:MAG TPA: GlsB/YeaQ/YmgE family stress response membrane protein [Abditibacterium sp.]
MKTNASMGAIANILCGIVGAFLGGMISRLVPFFGSSGRASFNFMDIVFGVIGACIVIAIVKAVTGGSRRAV